ncbi:hypothetical protein ANO11243_055510 [Dothideomycetidae sp. 11243]|nr:hypothetical protein ANO11243_055510 [fungal sp. No.11243]
MMRHTHGEATSRIPFTLEQDPFNKEVAEIRTALLADLQVSGAQSEQAGMTTLQVVLHYQALEREEKLRRSRNAEPSEPTSSRLCWLEMFVMDLQAVDAVDL